MKKEALCLARCFGPRDSFPCDYLPTLLHSIHIHCGMSILSSNRFQRLLSSSSHFLMFTILLNKMSIQKNNTKGITMIYSNEFLIKRKVGNDAKAKEIPNSNPSNISNNNPHEKSPLRLVRFIHLSVLENA